MPTLAKACTGDERILGLRLLQVIEVGQVGKAAEGRDHAVLYAHAQRGSGYGPTRQLVAELGAAAVGVPVRALACFPEALLAPCCVCSALMPTSGVPSPWHSFQSGLLPSGVQLN